MSIDTLVMVRPSLFCPFTPSLHPSAERTQSESVERWAGLMGFAPESDPRRRLAAGHFGILLSRCHPRAQLEDLRLIVDWANWLFLWDDFCDRCDDGAGAQAERIQARVDAVNAVLAGGELRTEDPLVRGLWDVLGRLRARMPAAWLVRLSRDIEDYFEGTVWQARTLASRVVPDVATYCRLRRLTSGMYMAIDMIELAEGIHLPVDARTSPTVAKLVRTTANLVCWANDIFSLKKELTHGDDHNLAMVIAARERVPLREALAQVVAIHNAEIVRFLELEKQLPSFDDVETDAAVRRFVLGLRSWVRANIDWSLGCGRYGTPVEVLAELPPSHH